jgi:hypothetical protein
MEVHVHKYPFCEGLPTSGGAVDNEFFECISTPDDGSKKMSWYIRIC